MMTKCFFGLMEMPLIGTDRQERDDAELELLQIKLEYLRWQKDQQGVAST